MANLTYPQGFINAINNIQTSDDTYAIIHVTYAAGSTCTCSKSSTILTAGDTSGEWGFGVNGSGNWTVSCTNGNESESKTVTISEYGQVEKIDLHYLPDPGDVLNNYSWKEISQVAQAGVGDDYFDIGDCKEIVLNGAIGDGLILSNYTTYIYILDFNHPINKTIADNNIIFGGFKTALTSGTDVCLCDSEYGNSYSVYAGSIIKYFTINHCGSTQTSPYNTNYGGWAACDLRYDILGTTEKQPSVYGSQKTTSAIGYDATQAAINSPMTNTLMAALPSDMRTALRLWTRWVDNKGNGGNLNTDVTAIFDAGISLLAEYEIFGTRSLANKYEQNHQKQMAYYTAGNSKIKYKHNARVTAADWWESSTTTFNTYGFSRVRTDGSADYYGTTYYSFGLAPAFKV